jgi:hypothetical protein
MIVTSYLENRSYEEVVSKPVRGSTKRFKDFAGKSEYEQSLRVFENRVQRRMLGPKREEVTGHWRKLHDVELHVV